MSDKLKVLLLLGGFFAVVSYALAGLAGVLLAICCCTGGWMLRHTGFIQEWRA